MLTFNGFWPTISSLDSQSLVLGYHFPVMLSDDKINDDIPISVSNTSFSGSLNREVYLWSNALILVLFSPFQVKH